MKKIKSRKQMKTSNFHYIIATLICWFGMTTALHAQVTIGSNEIPAQAALLDVKSQLPDSNNITSTKGGLLLPRVMLVDPQTLEPFVTTSDPMWTNATQKSDLTKKHIGLQVYNLATTNGFTRGMYIWDGTTWQKQDVAGAGAQQNVNYFFYLPSFNIELEETTDYQTVDLYAEYERQFTRRNTPDNTFISNPAYDLDVLPIAGTDRLYTRDELDYAITDFDDTLIFPHDLTVSNEGKLKFKLRSAKPTITAKTYINVVFIIKK